MLVVGAYLIGADGSPFVLVCIVVIPVLVFSSPALTLESKVAF